MIGLGVAARGLASLGNTRNWWIVKGLAPLNQIDATIMIFTGTGEGILSIILGIKGFKKTPSPDGGLRNTMTVGNVLSLDLKNAIEEGGYTYFLQPDGYHFAAITKKNNQLTVSAEDLAPTELSREFRLSKYGGYYRIEALNLEFNPCIMETLPQNTYTYVRQIDGLYSLIDKDNENYITTKKDVALKDLITSSPNAPYQFIETSWIPDNVKKELTAPSLDSD